MATDDVSQAEEKTIYIEDDTQRIAPRVEGLICSGVRQLREISIATESERPWHTPPAGQPTYFVRTRCRAFGKQEFLFSSLARAIAARNRILYDLQVTPEILDAEVGA